jgi:hypothetical protein
METVSIDTAILGYLSTHPLSKTINIARGLYGENAKSKDINKYLYRLKETGVLQLYTEANGSNPRWSVSETQTPRSTIQTVSSMPVVTSNILSSTGPSTNLTELMSSMNISSPSPSKVGGELTPIKSSEELDDMSRKILSVLSDTPKSTLSIAKDVIGPSGKAKDINRTLYYLLDKKLVNKISETNGVNPRWFIAPK